ncbi:D-cysteine desulfhydrase [Allocatelliglobosispora scoriae]|uniref:D-cysteine desulfhydrase n=1 Tax=Allocatelliglobosispora scoriae TaxID=643052 RepID=A0A841BK87_9ACTN|nr:pyridoxal-phosphate dependent enzyme [Allocatelliglobosispora scoriae]MBB5868055.1 D-cysteine desulfhydrase [Allocatelliglobosispora scoriae]
MAPINDTQPADTRLLERPMIWPRRVDLGGTDTPLEQADRLGAALGFAPGALWVKRDDLTGLGGGGNKVRHLEYLCADAIDRGCDLLVTGGGPQSNHIRLTAAAANRVGLRCRLVISGSNRRRRAGNMLLTGLLQPEIRWVGDISYPATQRAIGAEVERARSEGYRPYHIPVGGASAMGAVGYARAAEEIQAQLPGVGLIATATASGGTHAGLAVGMRSFERVLGVDVAAQTELDTAVTTIARGTAELCGVPYPAGVPRFDHRHAGRYGAVTDAVRWAIAVAGKYEGLLLDPVYTARVLAALGDGLRHGELAPTTTVVLLHTGGTPILHAVPYRKDLR